MSSSAADDMARARRLFPGTDHYDVLASLHHWLKPRVYVEIGVQTGRSFCLCLPHTRYALGIDPDCHLVAFRPAGVPHDIVKAESDVFFKTADLGTLLAIALHPDKDIGRETFDFAFIDGLHHFEQVLRDFMNLERYANKDSVIAIHDSLPLDRETSSRALDTPFATGDVWKAVVALQHYRRDIDIFTIACPPSGLTIVTKLDPASKVLAEDYDDIVAGYMPLEVHNDGKAEREMVGFIPNDWREIAKRLPRIVRREGVPTHR